MNKKINVKPVDILTLEFPDGTTRDAKFTSAAIMILDDEFDGFASALANAKAEPFQACGKLLYAGMKACDPAVEYERVQEIVSDFNISTLMDVLDFVSEAVKESIDTGEEKLAGGNRKNRRASPGTK